MPDRALAIPSEACEVATELDHTGRKSVHDRRERLDSAHRHGTIERLVLQHGTIDGADGCAIERVAQSVERPPAVGQEDESEAAFAVSLRALEQRDRYATVGKPKGEAQFGDASADDRRVQGTIEAILRPGGW